MSGRREIVSRCEKKSHFFLSKKKKCRFPGPGGSCVPAAGKVFSGAKKKLCPDDGASLDSISVEKNVRFPAPGEAAPGKLFPGAAESCVPAPGKPFPVVGEKLAGRRLV